MAVFGTGDLHRQTFDRRAAGPSLSRGRVSGRVCVPETLSSQVVLRFCIRWWGRGIGWFWWLVSVAGECRQRFLRRPGVAVDGV